MKRRQLLLSLAAVLTNAKLGSSEDTQLQLRGIDLEEVRDRPKWLFVGVDKYQYMRSLKYAADDAVALSSALSQPGQRSSVLKKNASKDEIETTLRDVFGGGTVTSKIETESKNTGCDSAIVFLSGHGVHVGGQSYFVPIEGRYQDPSTLISISEIRQRLAACNAKHRILICDACRNNPLVDKGVESGADEGHLKLSIDLTREPPPGMVSFVSCSKGERSYESHEFRHGVFTHFILEALKCADEQHGNDDGIVTMMEAFPYVTKKVKAHFENWPYSQTPTMRGQFDEPVPLGLVADFQERKARQADLRRRRIEVNQRLKDLAKDLD